MIPVTKEPVEITGGLSGLESCCFCWENTPFWHVPKDVAVCLDCAKTHDPEDVPTKEEWVREAHKRAKDLGLLSPWSE